MLISGKSYLCKFTSVVYLILVTKNLYNKLPYSQKQEQDPP